MDRVLILASVLLLWTPHCIQAEPGQFRGPAALALSEDGTKLFVGNRRTGSISVIDTSSYQVLQEAKIANTLSDLYSHGNTLKVWGEQHLLELHHDDLSIVKELKTRKPHKDHLTLVIVSNKVFTASKWRKKVSSFYWGTKDSGVGLGMGMMPSKLLLFNNDSKILIADSFGGQLHVVDVWTNRRIQGTRNLPGHNIGGLAWDQANDRILISHQILNPLARANHNDIRWGNLMENVVRSLKVQDLLNPDSDNFRFDEKVYYLGKDAADPGGIVTFNGGFAVALTGVDKVAIVKGDQIKRLSVGRLPNAMVLKQTAVPLVFVANEFSDSISVINLETEAVETEIKLGPMRPFSDSERGELLFRNGNLSLGGWMSCHSCHTDGHSNGQLVDTFSDGSFETPKRVLSLRGVKDTGPWGWTGSKTNLDDHIRSSITNTMRGPNLSDLQIQDIKSFLESLPPAPPKFLEPSNHRIQRGKEIFKAQKCGVCHTAPTYTSKDIYDVGLEDESGLSKFNPPSLRGISKRTGGYLHDGRVKKLEDVFLKHRHEIGSSMSTRDIYDLVRYLEQSL